MKSDRNLALWDCLPMDMRPKIRYWLPAAAVEESDLRAEIQALHNRGFGGIEIISLIVSGAVSSLGNIARGAYGWGTARWNNVIQIINDEAGRLGMSIDITNGPGWPISSPAIQSAENDAILCELTYGAVVVASGTRYDGTVPAPRSVHEQGNARIIHVLAYREQADGSLSLDSYIDLRPFVSPEGEKHIVRFDFPQCEAGRWRLFAFYQQPAIQKTNVGQHFVIDHLSRQGINACAEYWDDAFAENTYGAMESFFCDSLEYHVSLDWTPGLLTDFERRRGYSLLPYLPFIGLHNTYPPNDVPGYVPDDALISELINNDYMETLTQLYCENHLTAMTEMAARYGKTVRYQVAYNKPLEVERSALYVQIPENEALGRPAVDYQKTMAAAVHLGRKERYSFECAAEFGNSYGQDFEDLFWWVKRSYMAGMNAQVLHGASYSGGYTGEYSVDGNVPDAEWPGYEAFLKTVSNNWNRTLSVPSTRACLDAMTRMNLIFRQKARVDCAILRASYSNDGEGNEFCLYDDAGVLTNAGYSYEFVSEHLLRMDVCTVKDNLLDADGVGYKCLIVPEMKIMSTSTMQLLVRFASAGLPVIWIGTKPVCSRYYAQWNTAEKRDEWSAVLAQAWCNTAIIHIDDKQSVTGCLKAQHIDPEIGLDGHADIMTATRIDGEMRYYALYGYNRVKYSPENPNPYELACSALYKFGTTKGSYRRPGVVSRKRIDVRLKGKGFVYQCDPWSAKTEGLPFRYDANLQCMVGTVEIEEDEMILLALMPSSEKMTCKEWVLRASHSVHFERLELQAFGPNDSREVSFLRSRFSDEKASVPLKRLLPWRQLDSSLECFAGRGIYHGYLTVNTEEKDIGKRKFVLCLGNVSDTFTVWINGCPTDFPDQVMKRVDVSGMLHTGQNEIKVIVTSNLYNRLFYGSEQCKSGKLRYLPRDYGIWESEHKAIALLEYS